jgi:spore coat protein U-like protein
MNTFLKNYLTKASYCLATGLLISTAYISTASAATLTNNLAVSANVAPNCTVITPSALAFGAYTGTTNLDVATTIAVTCVNLTPYTIALNAGTGSGATTATRKLTSGANTLNYAIFSNPTRTANWGNTIGTDTVAGTGNGSSQIIQVYGRIPSGQTLNVGSYTDTVVATIDF